MVRRSGFIRTRCLMREPARNRAHRGRREACDLECADMRHRARRGRAEASPAARACVEEVIGQGISRFAHGVPMQVELALNGPVASAQFGENVQSEAGATEGLLRFLLLADLP